MKEPSRRASTGDVYAVLADTLDDEYEETILTGVIQGAREAGATVLCVTGGSIADAAPERASQNFVFDLVGAGNASGILVISSSVGSALGPARLEAWLQRFSGLPLCSVGVALRGYASVRVDNAAGAREAVTHLIREHGMRRIAYIRGPRGSAEADARFDAYCAALAAEGLAPDPRWLVDGDFTRPSGADAVRALLGGAGLKVGDLDAVVAANDYMALGAIEELARRGVRVPDDLAVVGFDDIDSARLARPALTTVRQPIEMLGRYAARSVTGQIGRKPVEDYGLLSTELVRRSSCGCSVQGLASSLTGRQASGRGLQASFVHRRQVIIAEVARSARGRFGGAGPGWETRLLDALLNELRGERGSFLRELEKMLRLIERSRPDATLVQEVLTGLRLQSLPSVADEPAARERLEDAFHDARAYAAAFADEAAAGRCRHDRDCVSGFHRALHAAMFAGGPELSRACAAALPGLGIEACLVAALPAPGDLAGEARVAFGFGPGGKLAGSEPIALSALPAHELLERSGRTHVLLPLVHRNEPLGVALVSLTALDGTLLEDLRDGFAAALMARLLNRNPPQHARYRD